MENELIPIINDNGKRVVDARILHDFLGSKRDFSNWIKDRIDKCDLVENQDFVVYTKFGENLSGGRPLKEYALTIDAAKEISMIEGNEKGKKARRYFIEVEKEYKKNLLVLPNFNNPAEAARAWADQYEEAKKQEQRAIAAEKIIEEQQPKVLFADSMQASEKSCYIKELADVLAQNGIKIGRNRMFDWLRDNGYLCTSGAFKNQPKQKYIEMGLFQVSRKPFPKNGVTIISTTTMITQKGQMYFINKFLNKGMKNINDMLILRGEELIK